MENVLLAKNSLLPSCCVKQKELFRWTCNFAEIDPDFDFQIHYVKLLSASDPIQLHGHVDATEIVYVHSGEQFYRVDGEPQHVLGGQMLLTPPQTLHDSGGLPEQKGDFYYFTINPDCLEKIMLCEDAETVTRLRNMLLGPTRIYSMADTGILKARMEELYDLFETEGTCRRTRICCALCGLLLMTLDSEEKEEFCQDYVLFMEQVYLYIEDHICENITVEQLADRFGYSVTALQNKFRSYSQLTVHQYILERKIQTAKKWLEEGGGDPYAIWQRLSFSSQSYFNRVFKKRIGKSVAQYIKDRNRKPDSETSVGEAEN